ncbi:MAG TPA: nucleoside monophosphate kinase [Candidatus Saccharimonadales bacterium]|nr:nucleoside monophosphate kinase [Candidatus Saccharimonadales bacterium]
MILLMGLPGSGKGTQGKMLADLHGMHLVSMGEIIRMYVTGEQRKRMLAGELLSDEEVIAILEKVLDTLPPDEECILDGFPRTIPQAEWLLKKLESRHTALKCIIHLTASPEAVKARLKARGRMDDKDEVIEERFREYDRLTRPLFEWFTSQHIAVVEINAERPVQQVSDDIVQHIRPN